LQDLLQQLLSLSLLLLLKDLMPQPRHLLMYILLPFLVTLLLLLPLLLPLQLLLLRLLTLELGINTVLEQVV
jgi:hypothetical protein